MKIRINGHDFVGALWNVQDGKGTMYFETNESIATIISEIGVNSNIEVYNDEQELISTWYNSCILSANEYKRDGIPNHIEITFAVSILSSNAEEVLNAAIEESVDGIFDLANYINELDTEHTETRRRIDLYSKTVTDVSDDFNTKHKDTNDKFELENQRIQELVASVNVLRDDITAVQASIDDIPKDIVNRFSELWNNYNALADRVARLENKEA